jgi:hypothetical protein
MKFGQFCGLLADEMDLPHSDFILGAEMLFAQKNLGAPVEENSFSLPDKTVSVSDAALLICLIVAMDQGGADPSHCAECAEDISGLGQNLSVLIAAIQKGQQAVLDTSGTFQATVTIPEHLAKTISPLVRGGLASHLRSI